MDSVSVCMCVCIQHKHTYKHFHMTLTQSPSNEMLDSVSENVVFVPTFSNTLYQHLLARRLLDSV